MIDNNVKLKKAVFWGIVVAFAVFAFGSLILPSAESLATWRFRLSSLRDQHRLVAAASPHRTEGQVVLAAALDSASDDVGQRALLKMASTPGWSSMPHLDKALERQLLSTSRVRRRQAIHVLALRSRMSVRRIRETLKDGDPVIRSWAAFAIGYQRQAHMTADLRTLVLTDPDISVRIEALKALASFGPLELNPLFHCLAKLPKDVKDELLRQRGYAAAPRL